MKLTFATLAQFGKSAVASTFAVAALAVSAHATPIAVVNGSFEQTTTKASTEFGDRYSQQQVTGWTTNGYNFVFLSGTADKAGATGEYGNVKLWGPGDGSNNGLPVSSPDGGNFLALDGAYAQGAVSQTLTGLTVGALETVSFYFAGAQQYGFDGANTEALTVSLGNQSMSTPVLQNLSHGFTGWQKVDMTFTATSTSETLSFLANGTPSGVPPMSLLDGVSVTQTVPTPEPSSLALLGTGLAGASSLLRSRFRKNSK